jgi:hypothetical protein
MQTHGGYTAESEHLAVKQQPANPQLAKRNQRWCPHAQDNGTSKGNNTQSEQPTRTPLAFACALCVLAHTCVLVAEAYYALVLVLLLCKDSATALPKKLNHRRTLRNSACA